MKSVKLRTKKFLMRIFLIIIINNGITILVINTLYEVTKKLIHGLINKIIIMESIKKINIKSNNNKFHY